MHRIRVSAANPHLLETEDGASFFWLGDTAWELLHRLTFEQIDFYLKNRAEKGFNVILVNVLAEFGGLTVPNAEGDLPLIDLDPARPNPRYLEFARSVINRAAEYGLHVAMLPAWGDKLTAPWGEGPRVFSAEEPQVAQEWARRLAEEFGSYSNVVWILGGDRPAYIPSDPRSGSYRQAESAGLSPEIDWRPVWDAMATGIHAELGSRAFISYHPQGGPDSTSSYLHDRDWLDMHMIQSGHGGGHDQPIWDWIARDYALTPIRPTMDAEPNYEDHPVSPWPKWDPKNGYFDEYDVRKQCYRSVFAGAAGVVYGHHAIWQFWDDRYEAINHVDRSWLGALDRPGAHQVGYLRRLMDSVAGLEGEPSDASIVGDLGSGPTRMCACGDPDSTWLMVYIPTSDREIQPRGNILSSPHSSVWFDPRTGVELAAVGFEGKYRTPDFGPDWVLLVRRC